MRLIKSSILSIAFFASLSGWAQTPNFCNEYTSVGTTNAGVNPGACATPGQVPNGGGSISVWTGTGCAGFITSTVTGPPVSCLTLSYTAVNQNDYGTMTTDTGGMLTITGVNTGIAGNVVGPYDCGGSFVGSVQITVCSTIPFNSVTLTNSGCTSGWVINCATQTGCGGGGGGNAGADDLTTVSCVGDGSINLNPLVTGDAGGTWEETTVPASGNFNTVTGIFDADAAGPGIYTFDYIVSGGCAGGDTAEFQVEVLAMGDASWTLPPTSCSDDPDIDLNTLITGTAGGTWSGTGVTGNMFDPSSGSQNVTYTVGTAPCEDANTQTIDVTPAADPTWASPGTICQTAGIIDLSTLVSGTGGGTWSGTGVTGNNFDPAGLSGAISVTYTVGAAPCTGVETNDITVVSNADASWTVPATLCDDAPALDLNTLVTGTAGGTWSGTGVTGNMFDPSSGSQNITYTVGTNPCDDAVSQMINVVAASDPTWVTPGNICENAGTVDLNALITGTAGGTWSGTGVTGNNFDPTGLSGPISVTYTVGTAPCIATLSDDITVTPDVDPSWAPPVNVCDASPLVDLNALITGTPGGTWSGTGVTGSDFDPASGTQMITYTVGTAPCEETSVQQIDVVPTPNPAWTTLSLCATAPPFDLSGQITGDPGGTWSGVGITGSTFDPSVGAQSVTYTVSAGTCSDMLTQTIDVGQPQVDVAFTNVSCFGDANGTADATVTGGSGNYTYLWTPGGQTTASVTGLAAGDYTVTVTDNTYGCSDDVTITIVEPAEITGVMTAANGCSPGFGSASVTAGGGVGGFTYAWANSASTFSTADDLDSAMQAVTVTDANGCIYEDSIFVHIFDSPIISLTPDTLIAYNYSIVLFASGADQYSWDPTYALDCDDCPYPIASPLLSTEYCVTGIDTNGCIGTNCVQVDVEIICGDIFVPSGFSPNADGENDELCVYSDCMNEMDFTIYNRWGEVVFESGELDFCWDGTWKGKDLNPGVFVYILSGQLINGDLVQQKGNITLIR
jgi:gliding motility-associated-like protein